MMSTFAIVSPTETTRPCLVYWKTWTLMTHLWKLGYSTTLFHDKVYFGRSPVSQSLFRDCFFAISCRTPLSLASLSPTLGSPPSSYSSDFPPTPFTSSSTLLLSSYHHQRGCHNLFLSHSNNFVFNGYTMMHTCLAQTIASIISLHLYHVSSYPSHSWQPPSPPSS